MGRGFRVRSFTSEINKSFHDRTPLITLNFKQRTDELLGFLCQRGHKRDYVKTQINKAFSAPRKTLYYQHKKSSNRTVFVTTCNPSLPNFNNIIKKYHPILTASNRCKNAFKDPALLAYRCSRNLRDTLVRAKVKTPKTSPPSPPKITRCNDGRCKACKFIAHNTTSYTFHNYPDKPELSVKISLVPLITGFT